MFLINSFAGLDENPAYFGPALYERGWTVSCGLLHTLSIRDDRIWCLTAPLPRSVRMQDSIPGPPSLQPVDGCDLVWVLNRPHPSMAFDIWQMLWLRQRRCEFANSVEALFFLDNKSAVPFFSPPLHRLEAHVANEFDLLWSVHESEPPRRWVAKPTNGASGTDVYVLEPGDTNARAILQSITGNTMTTQVSWTTPGWSGCRTATR